MVTARITSWKCVCVCAVRHLDGEPGDPLAAGLHQRAVGVCAVEHRADASTRSDLFSKSQSPPLDLFEFTWLNEVLPRPVESLQRRTREKKSLPAAAAIPHSRDQVKTFKQDLTTLLWPSDTLETKTKPLKNTEIFFLNNISEFELTIIISILIVV